MVQYDTNRSTNRTKNALKTSINKSINKYKKLTAPKEGAATKPEPQQDFFDDCAKDTAPNVVGEHSALCQSPRLWFILR